MAYFIRCLTAIIVRKQTQSHTYIHTRMLYKYVFRTSPKRFGCFDNALLLLLGAERVSVTLTVVCNVSTKILQTLFHVPLLLLWGFSKTSSEFCATT